MNTITRHKLLFLFLSIIVALPFLIQVHKVKTVDNVDYFTLENDPDVLFYDEFKDVFGNDEFFIIAFKKENFFTYENLNLLKNITESLEEIDGIREVKSLANVNNTIGENDFFIVQHFLEEIPSQEEEIFKLKQQALSNPLYVKNFISTDGKTPAIVISVYDKPNDPGYRKRIVKECNAILDKYQNKTGNIFMAGWTTTNLYLSQFMKKDISIFIPVTYIFITFSVFLFFRNVWLTIAAVLNISICMGATMGLFPILGVTQNNVTTIVPPVVMALALCDTVHIFSHLEKSLLDRFGSSEAALSHVLKRIFLPCFLTTLTTSIGFMSLYLSSIPPIRDFAVIASCGMIFEFFFSFTFLPSILLFFNKDKIFQKKSDHKKLNTLLEQTAIFVTRYYRVICVSGVFILICAFWMSSWVKVETNLIEYFKKDSVVRISTDFVENNLAGVETLEISLEAKSGEELFKRPENLKLIENVQDYISKLNGIDKTLSFVDFIKDMNQSFHNEDPKYFILPDSQALVSQYLLLYGEDDIEDFVNDSFSHARISARVSSHGTLDQKKLVGKIQEYLLTLEQENINISITGRIIKDLNTVDAIVEGQVTSLAVASSIIAGIMFLVLNSFMIGALSLLPNLFPIIINFGLMGLFGIPLNEATALIAAVALGIAVDDTIHFLTEYKKLKKSSGTNQERLKRVIFNKGKAIILSSIILSIGFGVMVFSQFTPTVHFGLLSAIIMISAVIGDLVLLPAIMMLKKAW